jgi:hypothetical protein
LGGPGWPRPHLLPILAPLHPLKRGLRPWKLTPSLPRASASVQTTLYVPPQPSRYQDFTTPFLQGRNRSLTRPQVCKIYWDRASNRRRLGDPRETTSGNTKLNLTNRLFQESHASHIESNMISQVRVANIGQEINVWVMGRTRVRLRVGETVLYRTITGADVFKSPWTDLKIVDLSCSERTLRSALLQRRGQTSERELKPPSRSLTTTYPLRNKGGQRPCFFECYRFDYSRHQTSPFPQTYP